MTEQRPRVQLTFGVDRDPDEIVVGRSKFGTALSNPCIVAFGPGPEGRQCGSCAHLYRQGGVAGRYLKCELRRNTSGPATDHRSRWPACARYVERVEDET